VKNYSKAISVGLESYGEEMIRDCSGFQGMEDRNFREALKKHEQNMILIAKLKWVARKGIVIV